ncbi:undecaprenyl phosphate N,N'-diacetylbacillosamine 1-phosphate transferase [Flavobacteriaceae bacterium UJ101]|nr:undecaprenyl phosphate N,N'-diacetylbacillosamine 1-phosphate transferase [Flavobacteriaceae bacterium UJ101]
MYKKYIKRSIDFLIAFVGFIIVSPVFIIVTVFLFFVNEGKPFFFQKRPGKDEKIFSIIKFKTMNDKKDSEGNLLSDEQRMTTIGTLVRKTSLDEIPQLLNVIKGDMSLIGPRPLLVEYLDYYNDDQKKRHNVRPGITGWAQINGRNTISWEKKFELDVWYVQNISFKLDCQILLKTLLKVVKTEGISPTDQLIMPKFSDYMNTKNNKK